ncbi:WD repeat containing protein [Parasponia andersonii]|uniref:WD repeat containing protein n=1 Tax=Parasponia andersonii TaxID=3476 RepID=A0A2P5BNZ0_PARAD|nr:WD repeat containing protein [Parasponia andersonii]
MAEPPSTSFPPPPLPPKESVTRRYKLVWRLLLISNLALGAYIFARPRKKDTSTVKDSKASEKAIKDSKAEEKMKADEEVRSAIEMTQIYETATLPPPAKEPVKVHEPIPEDQQRELFKWMLEEKRKVKSKDPEEKKRIDEDKAILKQFIPSVHLYSPLTTLRDNLIVVIQDAEGNEISHAGVETKLIVEKGLWDDIFPLEGGGQVHLKLQFVLNEDERNRIRMMRESAMKKKHGELLNCRTSTVEFATNDSSKVASSLYHMISDKNEETSSAIALSQRDDLNRNKISHNESNDHVEAQSLSADTPIRAVYSKESPNEKVEAQLLSANKPIRAFYSKESSSSIKSSESSFSSGERRFLEKIPRSVKKMISAFETNVSQDMTPHIKPSSPEKLQANKFGLDIEEAKATNKKIAQGTAKFEELSTTKERVKKTNISQNSKFKLVQKELDTKDEKSDENILRTLTIEKSSAPDRVLDRHRHLSYNDSDKQHCGGISVVEESLSKVSAERSQSLTILGASTHDLRSVVDYEDMDETFEGSGAWIFPDQLRRFCVTTGGKKLMDFLGGYSIKPEVRAKKMNLSTPEKPKEDGGPESEVDRRKKTHKVKNSKPKSEEVESSTGPVGQAIKVAIMVGFGILVLFTRQRNNSSAVKFLEYPELKMVRSIKNPKKAKRKNKGKGDGSSSSSVPSMPAKVWQPGVDKLEEGEELQCDPSAYNSLHAFHIGWPCLSFDIVRDALGLVRTEFPHTAYLVAGTQAEKAAWNSIGIFRISNISGKRRELVPTKSTTDGSDMDSDDSDSELESEDEGPGGSGAPILQAILHSPLFTHFYLLSIIAFSQLIFIWILLRKLAHDGCVNRIRAMTQIPHICASWADTGHMQIWDVSSHLNALAESESDLNQGAASVFNQAPLFKFGHKDEGFAIDWSPLVPGRLLTGDCKNYIHFWEPTSDASWKVDATPFIGHTASVEDLQWSPTEHDIFASCSVDGTIAIWDVRTGKKPVDSFKAHDADVNVISWNRLASCMLASGSDDGTFSIHDLRSLKNKERDTVVAHFAFHKHPITSIEWSPHEASTLAVSSADNQLTIWDLSLERDEEEEAEFRAKTKEEVNAPQDLPPQLLFVHQGQKDIKELHWNSQIPGMIISTAGDGFNILMPSNIQNTLPSDAA